MKISHYFDKKYQIGKKVPGEPGFILTNKVGGYLWLTSQPVSRYQGWFFVPEPLAGKKMFKIIENIDAIGGGKIVEIKNSFGFVSRQRENLEETFFLPLKLNSLVYETSAVSDTEIFLDIKESYNNEEYGREYDVSEEQGVTLIRYRQAGADFPEIFLAIRTDGGKEKTDQWVLRHYPLDEKRNSHPFKRYALKALRINAKKIVFSVSENKDQAIREVNYVFGKTEKLKKERMKEVKELNLKKTVLSKEVNLAYLCSQNSLKGLLVSGEKENGMFAGFPWFFQFWPRDEAISLLALSKIDKTAARNIFWRLLESVESAENIPISTDAVGWIFKRADDFIEAGVFGGREIKKISVCLENTIKKLLTSSTGNDGLALNELRGTWMDSVERTGAEIEIQALRLNMYKLAHKLTREEMYFALERRLRNQTRDKFFNGKALADGFDVIRKEADFTIRPNVFLAAYIYPGLLEKEEWISCFESALKCLWLSWGGVSTIDKKDPRFCREHTGENSLSYHNGDSWFYLNNLAALVLYRFPSKRFWKYTRRILEASINEILWQGVVASHAELSSAKKMEPGGCFSQAWSSALFIEALYEVFG